MATKKPSTNDPTGLPEVDYRTLYAGSDFFPDTSEADPEERGDVIKDDDDAPDDDAPDDEATDDEATDDDDDEPDDDEPDDDDDDEPDDDDDEPDETDDKPKKKAKKKASEDDDDDDDAPKKPGTVPKWRLDQQTAKLRQEQREKAELQRQLKRLTEGGEPAPKDAPDNKADDTLKQLRQERSTIHDEYAEAVIDGDTKKVKALREKLDDIEDKILDARFEATTSKVKQESASQAQIEAELNTAADKIQKRFDVFDQKSDNYSEDLVHETVAYRNALMEMGRNPGEALVEAAETIAKKYDIPEIDADEAPKPKKTPKQDPQRKKLTQDKKRVARKQPPKMKGNRNKASKVDIRAMSEREFDKLTDDQIRELRGDSRVE